MKQERFINIKGIQYAGDAMGTQKVHSDKSINVYKDSSPNSNSMGEESKPYIQVPNSIITDLEGLTRKLAEKRYAGLEEKSIVNPYDLSYCKTLKGGKNLRYSLTCDLHYDTPLEDEQVIRLVLEHLEAGDFEESLYARLNGTTVVVLRKNQGDYTLSSKYLLSGENISCMVEGKSRHMKVYEIHNFDRVKSEVWKIFSG